jgi:hypothetical protein
VKRAILFCCGAICAAAPIFPGAPLRAQMAEDTSVTAPPVAPPLKKGSPLDHLTNDPKLAQPVVGYREGNTQGAVYFVAHRGLDDMGGMGWGWLRKNGDGWGGAKWIALQEQPGLAVAPFRKLTKRDGDADWEFKFWGGYAKYTAYDPHLNELLPVFVLQGYEVIGPAASLNLHPGPPGRPRSRPSGASSRSSNPIQSGQDID